MDRPFILHSRDEVWWREKEFSADQAHRCAQSGRVSDSWVHEASLCTRSPWSNPRFQKQPQMSIRPGSQRGNEQSRYCFSFDCCFTEGLFHLTLPFSLLVFMSSPLFHTSRCSRSLSKLKGTSKCLGSSDSLRRHQTLWSVWGCFCQRQSAP